MDLERAFFNTGLCPFCGSTRILVTHTDKPRRRLRCRICQKRWGSLEIIETADGAWLPGVIAILLSQGRLAGLPFAVIQKLLSIAAN